MRVLVVYATKYGSTRGIAERIARTIEEAGHQAGAVPATHAGPLDGYDAYVIGSALYMFSWLKEAKDFVLHNRATLAAKPVWLFSSGPIGTAQTDAQGRDVRENAGPKELGELMAAVNAREHRVFFGAFDHTKLTVAHRVVYAMPAAKKLFIDGDFRDWDDIEAWAIKVAAALVPVGVS